MSRIIIRANPSTLSIGALAEVKVHTRLAAYELHRVVKQGGLIFDEVLFSNDHATIAGRLLRLLAALQRFEVSFCLYELSETIEHLEETDRIDEETLMNILSSHGRTC
jgi:hypothetical protein